MIVFESIPDIHFPVGSVYAYISMFYSWEWLRYINFKIIYYYIHIYQQLSSVKTVRKNTFMEYGERVVIYEAKRGYISTYEYRVVNVH